MNFSVYYNLVSLFSVNAFNLNFFIAVTPGTSCLCRWDVCRSFEA